MRAILLALCMLACTAAAARSFTVNDLLGVESYGQMLIVPRHDLILVEKRGGYAAAADFAYDTYFTSRMVTRIMATSLEGPGKLAPLFPQPDTAGYWIGSLSPKRTRLAVLRLEDRRLTMGVVDLATRAVQWLEPAPDLPGAAPAPVWVDEDHLAYVAMIRPRLPASLMMGTAGTSDVRALWDRQAQGGMSRTLVSSRTGTDGSSGERRLVIVGLNGDPIRVLATGNIVDVVFSRHCSQVAVVTTGEPVPPPHSAIDTGFDSRRHRLRIIDVASGREHAVTGEVLSGVMAWSADGRLLVATRHGGSDWSRAKWTAVDRRGRAISLGSTETYAAIGETAAGRLAYAGWAGTSPIALVRRGRTAPAWVRLSATGATALPLSPGARPIGSMPSTTWLLDGSRLSAVDASKVSFVLDNVRQAGLVIADPYSRGHRLNENPDALEAVIVDTPKGAAIRSIGDNGRMRAGPAMVENAQLFAADADRALVVRRDRYAVTTLLLLEAGRRPREIDRVNTKLADIELPRAIELKTRGPNGTVLHDWLLLPPRATGKLPLVVNLYPGLAYGGAVPQEARIRRHAVSDNPLLLVSAGYAVLLPSMPAGVDRSPLDTILPRIDAATDAAVATGLVDRARIGLQGHSFGAYGAMVIATRSTRYKAIVAANGPYDLFATHGSMATADKLRFDYGLPAGSSIGWTEGGQAGMTASPPAAISSYVSASAMLHLDRVTTPLLLIAGDLDVVDMTQSERAFMELYRYGKDVRLARYWGENHTNASPANIHDYWRLTTAFFDEHLKRASATASPAR